MESMHPACGVSVCQSGWENCASSHAFGPAIRTYFLIHFIRAGRGVFRADGREWRLGPGDGFVIFPGEITFYQADRDDPWQYAWIGYEGPEAAQLTARAALNPEKRTFHTEDVAGLYRILRDAYEDVRGLRLGSLSAVGGLLRFLSHIGQEAPAADEVTAARSYCEKARWYMRGRLAQSVRIADAAAFVGLSRSQLFRAFQREEKKSPKEVLQTMRLELSMRLLKETQLTVSEIAFSVGMHSPQQLCALFRRHYGFAPSAVRQDISEET